MSESQEMSVKLLVEGDAASIEVVLRTGQQIERWWMPVSLSDFGPLGPRLVRHVSDTGFVVGGAA